MRTNGYINLHRRIQSSNLWGLKPEHIMIALTCLLNAEWKDVKRMGIDIKRGQWLTHLHEIEEQCPPGISRKQVRTGLSRLASRTVRYLGTRTVTIGGRRFVLVTVWNYDKYNTPPTGRAQGKAQGLSSTRALRGHKEGTTLPKEVQEVIPTSKAGVTTPGEVKQLLDMGTMILVLRDKCGEPSDGRTWAEVIGRYGAKKIGEMLWVAQHARFTGWPIPLGKRLVDLIDRERSEQKEVG